MGRPYTRLKYKPPEKYKSNGLIGHGEAVSMITDLLTPDGERWDVRRRVDNHVRYAVTGREGAGHCREYEARATFQGSRCTDQRDQCPTEADYLRA